MNSRGTQSGVVDLRSKTSAPRKYVTLRMNLPDYVSTTLRRLYTSARLKKGCPDLVLWNPQSKRVRLVEVKCLQWDATSREQERFLRAANAAGIPAKVASWEFRKDLSENGTAKKLVRLEFPRGASAEQIANVVNRLRRKHRPRPASKQQLENRRLMEAAARKMDANVTRHEDNLLAALEQAAEKRARKLKQSK